MPWEELNYQHTGETLNIWIKLIWGVEGPKKWKTAKLSIELDCFPDRIQQSNLVEHHFSILVFIHFAHPTGKKWF